MKIFIFVFAFFGVFLPFFVHADVLINEVAWMGTSNSAQDEWIELYSSSGENLDGWILKTADDAMSIPLSGVVPAGGYFLIERTDDTTVPDVSADLIVPFGSGLSNSGEILILENSSGEEIDKIDASGGWPAGDNTTKETMQRSGNEWIRAAGTPKAQNPSTGSGQVPSPTPIPTSSETSNQNQASGPPPKEDEKKMRAEIILSDTGIAGAEIFFEGNAFGFNGKETAADRYVWSFGDGAGTSGKNVSHTYQFPGVYQVSLSISKGEFGASGYDAIEIVPSAIFISEIKPGTDSWIEIRNGSSKKIDITGWTLSAGEKKFSFPQNTFISPNAYLVIPENISGIYLDLKEQEVALLYYSGKKADVFKYSGELSESQSFARIGTDIKITVATPGAGEAKIISKSSTESAKKSDSQTSKPNNKISEPLKIENAVEISTDDSTKIISEKEPDLTSGAFFSSSGFYWGLTALGIGVLAALGFFASRRIQ